MFWKKYKMWIIGFAVFIIIYIIIKKISERSPAMTMPNGGTVGGGVIKATFKPDVTKVDRAKLFAVGTKNSNEVAYLQQWINTYYPSYKLAVDGDFGSKTNTAFLAVQTPKPKNAISNSLESLGI